MDAGERPRRPMHRAGVARAAALTLARSFSAPSCRTVLIHTRLASCRVNVPPPTSGRELPAGTECSELPHLSQLPQLPFGNSSNPAP
eukprot:4537047-Prymnesium_polylepis.1